MAGDSRKRNFHPWTRRIARWLKGGNVPIVLDQPFRVAHRNMMWIGTVLWALAIAQPAKLDGAEAPGTLLISSFDLLLSGRLLACGAIVASLYFWWQFRHELAIEILKASKIGAERVRDDRLAVESKIAERQNDTMAMLDRLRTELAQGLNALNNLSANTPTNIEGMYVAFDIGRPGGIQDILAGVKAVVSDLSVQDAETRKSILADVATRLDNVQSGLLQLKNDITGAVALVQSDLNNVRLALQDAQLLEIDFKDLGRKLSQQVADFRTLDKRLSGGSRRKFTLLDRFAPQAYVALGAVLVGCHWFLRADFTTL